MNAITGDITENTTATSDTNSGSLRVSERVCVTSKPYFMGEWQCTKVPLALCNQREEIPTTMMGKCIVYGSEWNGMAWHGVYVYNIVPFGSETHSSALEPFKKRILLSMCAPVCMSVYVCPFLCACLFLCCWIHTRIWVLCAVCVYECILSLPFWLCMHSCWSIRSCTNRNTYICVSIHKNLLAVLLASAITLHSTTSLLLRARSAI